LWAELGGACELRSGLRWPLIAGGAAGLAAMMVSTDGALVALAGLVALNRRRGWTELLAYVLATAAVPLAMLAYVTAEQALPAALFDIIVWPARNYLSVNVVPFGFGVNLATRPLLYLFPLAGVLALLVCILGWRRSLTEVRLRTCVAFGLAGFIGCLSRPDIIHIVFGAPLVCPLLAYSWTVLTQRWRPACHYVAAAVVVALCLPAVLTVSLSEKAALAAQPVASPRGDVVFSQQPGAAEMVSLISATPSADGYFFYPYMSLMPFLTAREDVAPLDAYVPRYTTASQYRQACQAVMRRADWVVVDEFWTSLPTLRVAFPSLSGQLPPETREFERALYDGFPLVARYGRFELRHRRQGVDGSLCAGIAD
jgi:hypothetical protein